jgi:2-C-methyl-D-erythritol 4-phosphate cytidylyltransferase/2-C-methyl-D-erythritol 2,4-cyclodiphosphate synthase
MDVVAILLAAGSGSRFGGVVPKQYLSIGGKPVLRHAAEALLAGGHVHALQPVCAAGDEVRLADALGGLPALPPVPGGSTRAESVQAGLLALAERAPNIVLVHDAARPIVPPGTIEALLVALAKAPGAIPAQPVSDTLKAGADGMITRTVPRAGLFRAQTPQGFRYSVLRAAHAAADAATATDDAELLERIGQPVALVPGSEHNIKITWPEDIARVNISPLMVCRVGTGFDVHRLVEGRPLIVCGVTIPHSRGLDGHSDADVGIHALCDAIYGALGEGDIGAHFPPSEMKWLDADSAQFLVHAAARIAARGGRLINADVTLIAERPKFRPHVEVMRERLAQLLGVDLGRIGVKATTTEKLGFTGREEGIAAQAAVSVLMPDQG